MGRLREENGNLKQKLVSFKEQKDQFKQRLQNVLKNRTIAIEVLDTHFQQNSVFQQSRHLAQSNEHLIK